MSPSSYVDVSPKISRRVEQHVLVKDYMRSCSRTKVFIKHSVGYSVNVKWNLLVWHFFLIYSI